MTIIASLRERLPAEAQIGSAWLFGSVARGTESVRSDVDIAVLPQAPGARLADLLSDLSAELEGLFRRPVQIVHLEQAPPDLIHRVLRDGILLLDRDAARRIRFEVRARNLYFDMRPIWLEYRRVGRAAS